VIGRRHGEREIRMLEQLQDVAGRARQQLGGRIVEPLRPVERRIGLAPLHPPEVVDDIAAAEQEHATIPQGREPGRELQVVLQGSQRIDRQLDDGDVGLRVEVRQHAPGSMVQPPLVDVEADPHRLDQLHHLLREFRRAGRRIPEVEKFLGEAVEIVDRPGLRHGRDRGGTEVPVGRDDEYGTRPRQGLAECTPCLREPVALERVHRAAMPDEKRRHAPVHGRLPVRYTMIRPACQPRGPRASPSATDRDALDSDRRTGISSSPSLFGGLPPLPSSP